MKSQKIHISLLIACMAIWLWQPQSFANEATIAEQLSEMLSGEFDSFRQRQDDRDNKVEKKQAHGWVNRAFIDVDAPGVADTVLVGSTIYSGPTGIVDKNEFLVWILKQNAEGTNITMSPRRFKDLETKIKFQRDKEKLAGFSNDDLENAISGAACDILWTKSAKGFTGQSKPCRVMSTTKHKMLQWNWVYQLDRDGLSIEYSGTTDSGEILESSPSGKPYRLDRLTPESTLQQGRELLFNAQDRSEYRTSQALLKKAVNSDPQNAQALVALIYASLKTNQYTDAQSLLIQATALEDALTPSESLWLAGMKARIADNSAQEIEAWKKLVEFDPKQRWGWYELASVYYRSELYQQSIDAIQGALAAQPDEEKWGASYIYYLYSKSLYRMGKLTESIAAAEPGIRNANTQRATFYRKVIAQIAKGELNDPSDALNTYRELSRKDGKVNEANYQTNVALLFFELGDYSTAIKYAQAGYALSQKPYHAWALAYALTEKGDVEQAIEILNSANSAYPNTVNILAGLGWANYRSGQLNKALKYLRAAQKSSPRKNSGVERDLKIVKTAIDMPGAKQVPPMRWFGD